MFLRWYTPHWITLQCGFCCSFANTFSELQTAVNSRSSGMKSTMNGVVEPQSTKIVSPVVTNCAASLPMRRFSSVCRSFSVLTTYSPMSLRCAAKWRVT